MQHHAKVSIAHLGPSAFQAISSCLLMQVRSVPEDKDSADALRSVVPELKGKSFILISGDLVGDVSVKVRLHTLMHFEHCKPCPFQQFA